jgi:hypothetical protein
LQRLGSILAQLKIPGPGSLQLRQIEEAVGTALGPRAKGVRIASYRRGRLVLEVRSAARAFELQAFARHEVLDRLRAMAGLEQLAELQFRNGAAGSR